MCELALEIGCTLSEVRRESNFDVCVTWPAFFEERDRVQRIQAERQKNKQRGRR